MAALVVVDTGPLVAALRSRDRDHAWSRAQLESLIDPLATCEAVLSEAIFLLDQHHGSGDLIMGLVEQGVVEPAFSLKEHASLVAGMLKRYRNIPMSLADACLVRMSELLPGSTLLTLDGDFRVYRRHNRTVVPARMPTDGP